jgi:hypothetical protein
MRQGQITALCLLWTISACEPGRARFNGHCYRHRRARCCSVRSSDGIVRIVVHVVAGEDLGGRPRREINLLIGVTAAEDKCCDHDRDAEPHGCFPTHWSRPVGRSFGRWAGEVGHHTLRRRGGDLIEQRTLNFNSMRRQKWSRLSPDTRRGCWQCGSRVGCRPVAGFLES